MGWGGYRNKTQTRPKPRKPLPSMPPIGGGRGRTGSRLNPTRCHPYTLYTSFDWKKKE